ncbi:uncharacterized protein BJX67DRAFT_368997 [Aspergillus lucknowensis]|uniref:Aminoglycoside phosphotransferase domain-containing protein n=1 Tax=Aspergillus lucknowensis TaxID=176173 RepID=A0ABR4M6Q6_9EURO
MFNTRSRILKDAILAPKSISRNISLTSHGTALESQYKSQSLLHSHDARSFSNTRPDGPVNEKRDVSKRYAKFDLEALRAVVSSLPSVSSPISSIDKLEGGFNRALLMTAENGKEIIAKIPCPRVVPAEYSTASEAASTPTRIVGIIDWQFSSILPAFMQVQWPGREDKTLLSKCYEAALAMNHLDSYSTVADVHPVIPHFLSSTKNTWKHGILALRDSLIRIFKNWHQIRPKELRPYQITKDKLLTHRRELSWHRDRHELKEYTQVLLQTDDDGWISPQFDFDRVLFQLYLREESEEVPKEEARRLWFYIEGV